MRLPDDHALRRYRRRASSARLAPSARRPQALAGALAALTREADALRRRERFVRALARHLPNGAVFVFDHELRFLLAEGAALIQAGFVPAQMEGRTLHEALAPAASSGLEPLYRAILAGVPIGEIEQDWNGRVYRFFPVPLYAEDGRVDVGALFVIDVTEQRRGEQAQSRQLEYQSALARCSRALLANADTAVERVRALTAALGPLREATRTTDVLILENVADSTEGLCLRLLAVASDPALAAPPAAPLPERVPWSLGPSEQLAALAAGQPWGGNCPEDIAWPEALGVYLGPAGLRAIQAFPIHVGGRWWGQIVFVDRHSPRDWQRHELVLLGTAAEIVGTFVRRVQTEDSLRSRVSELSALNQIAQALTLWPSLPEALATVGATVGQLFTASVVTFWQLDLPAAALRLLARLGADEAPAEVCAPILDDPIAGQVVAHGTTAVLLAGEPAPAFLAACLPGPALARDLLVLPLLVRGEVVGVLTISAAAPGRSYAPSDVALAQTIAGLVAGAVENARLLAEEQRQRQVAESLREVTTALTSSLDQPTVLRALFAELRRVVAFDGAALMLPEAGDLVVVQAQGGAEGAAGRRVPIVGSPLAGLAFRQRRTRLRQDAAAEWRDRGGPRLGGLAAVPLLLGEEALGVLALDRCAGAPFSPDEVRVLEVFALQAAIAIENARRYADAGRAAAEEERRRLARELHDSVSQSLFAAASTAEVLPEIWRRDPLVGLSALDQLYQLTRSAQAEMRALLYELRPASLLSAPLSDLLLALADAAETRLGARLAVEVQPTPILPAEVQIALYRIAQEALNNIGRHAAARRAELRLRVDPPLRGARTDWQGEVELLVADDGRGFELTQATPGRLGLASLRERALAVGAAIELRSELGAGTQIMVRWAGPASEERRANDGR